MTRRRVGGYIFESYSSDHPPYHVHVFQDGEFLGRWDIENQRPMGNLVVTARLRRALEQAGYKREGDAEDDEEEG